MNEKITGKMNQYDAKGFMASESTVADVIVSPRLQLHFDDALGELAAGKRDFEDMLRDFMPEKQLEVTSILAKIKADPYSASARHGEELHALLGEDAEMFQRIMAVKRPACRKERKEKIVQALVPTEQKTMVCEHNDKMGGGDTRKNPKDNLEAMVEQQSTCKESLSAVLEGHEDQEGKLVAAVEASEERGFCPREWEQHQIAWSQSASLWHVILEVHQISSMRDLDVRTP